jgi:hypothetical protein
MTWCAKVQLPAKTNSSGQLAVERWRVAWSRHARMGSATLPHRRAFSWSSDNEMLVTIGGRPERRIAEQILVAMLHSPTRSGSSVHSAGTQIVVLHMRSSATASAKSSAVDPMTVIAGRRSGLLMVPSRSA